MWDTWLTRAKICRFGNQDLFRLIGRDPIKEPLTILEFKLFEFALQKVVEAEFSPSETSADYRLDDPDEE